MGDIPKNILLDCAEFMPVRFTIDSNWSSMTVLIFGVRNTNTNILFTWIVLKTNVMYMMCLINIQYNMKLLTAREGNMGNCHPSKTNVELGFASVDIRLVNRARRRPLGSLVDLYRRFSVDLDNINSFIFH